MGDRNFGRKYVGGFGVFLGLALVVWVILGKPGGMFARDDVVKDILLLFFALILIVSGGVALRTRVEDFEKRPTQVTCAGCDFQRRSEPGDVCPQCGSARLVLPRLNRLALGAVAITFGVPPVGVLGVLVVDGAPAFGANFEPTVVVVVTASLALASSSAFVLWQGRLPGIPWFLPLGASIRGELENILYSKAYALGTIFACFTALTIAATIFLSLD